MEEITATPPGPAWLFCPANRPDRYEKALERADSVIIDLEDAVAPGAKDGARKSLIESPIDPARVIVRINGSASPEFQLDIAAIHQTDYRWVMLPKVERCDELRDLGAWSVVALCETPGSYLALTTLAEHATIRAVMWGSEDLAAAVGAEGSRNADGHLVDYARAVRSAVLLAASAHSIPAVDTVYPDYEDFDGLSMETRDAVAQGFTVKACIHPNQVNVVREAMQPSDERLAWAMQVMDAANGGGVTAVNGQVIDAPVVRQAEHVIGRAVPAAAGATTYAPKISEH